MKKIFYSLVLLLGAISTSFATTGASYYDVVIDTTGKTVSNAIVKIYVGGSCATTCILATVYNDFALSSAIDQVHNPIVSDAGGRYHFFAPAGAYDIQETFRGSTLTFPQVTLGGGGGSIDFNQHTSWGGGTPVDTSPSWPNAATSPAGIGAENAYFPSTMIVSEQPNLPWNGNIYHQGLYIAPNYINHQGPGTSMAPTVGFGTSFWSDATIDASSTGPMYIWGSVANATDYSQAGSAVRDYYVEGALGIADNFGNTHVSYLEGLDGQAEHGGTGTMDNMSGIVATVYSDASSSTIGNMNGQLLNLFVDGTVTNVYGNNQGLILGRYAKTGTHGTVGNYYANYVAAPVIDLTTPPSTVANKYAFVSASGAGNFGINTLTPTHDLEVNGTTQTGNLIVTGTCTGCGSGGSNSFIGTSGIGISTVGSTVTISGPVIDVIYDCGLKGDGTTDDSAALQTCINNNPGRKILLRHTTAACSPSGNCRPVANYYMGTTTITMSAAGTQLVGEGNAKYNGGGTPIYWAPNTTGIIMEGTCTSCEIQSLYLSGPDNLGHPAAFPTYDQCWLGTSVTSGIFGSWPGIVMTGSSQVVLNSEATCFNGNGIFVRSVDACNANTAYTCSEPDLWRIQDSYINGNRGNGIAIEGNDTNVGTTEGTNDFGNELWGILDHNSFGDAHISPHTNGNGRQAISGGGINVKQAYWIQRTSNVVTACFLGSNTSPPPGFAVGNLISLAGASDSSFDSGSTPFTITAVSANTAGVACPLAGVSGSNAFGGWAQWTNTGSDSLLISVGPNIGIVSNINSISRTSNVVSVSATATTTSLTPSDIKAIGTWVKIIGTGNSDLDNHVFRPTVVTLGSGNSVTYQFPYIGPNISTISSTGYTYSAESADIFDPVQNIRSVFDGAITAGSTELTSETAQFHYRQAPPVSPTQSNPYACGLAGNVGCGAPVVVHGAGVGGADLVTYITVANYSSRVTLHDAASTTVTNAEVDMGGSWKGGAYFSYTATWINPYMEYTQTNLPLAFAVSTNTIGGNIAPAPNLGDGSGNFQENIGFNDAWIGSPVSLGGYTLQNVEQIVTYSDVPNGLTLRNGLTQNENTSLTIEAWDGTTAAPGGTSHTIAFSRTTPGDLELADNQIGFGGHSVYLRSLDPATTPSDYMSFGNGYPISFQFYGLCSGLTGTTNTGIFTINGNGTGNTLTTPCAATSTNNYNGIPTTTYGHAWNPISSTAISAGWTTQAIMTPGNSLVAPTSNTFSIHPVTITNSGGGMANLSTTIVSLDSIALSALIAMESSSTPVPAGTIAYCNNCVATTPASCSATNPSACVCTTGTGTMMAKYENFMNNGLNWYCGEGGAGLTTPTSLTTTSATSDNVTVTNMTSSGHCSLTATNSSAATNIATTYVSAKTTNQITVTHTATSGMTYDVVCTPN